MAIFFESSYEHEAVLFRRHIEKRFGSRSLRTFMCVNVKIPWLHTCDNSTYLFKSGSWLVLLSELVLVPTLWSRSFFVFLCPGGFGIQKCEKWFSCVVDTRDSGFVHSSNPHLSYPPQVCAAGDGSGSRPDSPQPDSLTPALLRRRSSHNHRYARDEVRYRSGDYHFSLFLFRTTNQEFFAIFFSQYMDSTIVLHIGFEFLEFATILTL